MAWIAYVFGLIRRALNWGALLLLVLVILYAGLAEPPPILTTMFGWWGHW